MPRLTRTAATPDSVDPASDPIQFRCYFSDAAASPPNALRIVFTAPGDAPGQRVEVDALASDVIADAAAFEAAARTAMAAALTARGYGSV